jgi:hypothetical protein
MGLFACGLSVIVAAALLNIAHDRLSGTGLEALPGPLASMYDASGKSGVTLVFVAAGMSIILLSVVLQRNRQAKRASNAPANPLASVPYFCTPTEEDDEQEVSPAGTMVLQTRKYLPASSLSGTTGWPATRKPPV